jgi:hypothetical protein
MIENDITCKECGKEFKDAEGVRRHVKVHKMTYEQYYLKWECNNIRSLCECGCGEETTWHVMIKRYNTYVHGHHAQFRIKSEDEKRRIGEKNSINQKRFFKEHPEACAAKVIQLRAGLTPEVEKRRLASTREAYKNMSDEQRQEFSDHAKSLWERESGIMQDARLKAAETFKRRFAAGEYDFTERNLNLSISISQKYLDGGWEFAKGMHTSSKTNEQHYYRSSWELALMQSLDEDIEVITWKSEFTRIPYIFEGAKHFYVPDFYVLFKDGTEQLIEVKPVSLRSTPKNAAKREVALEYCKEHGWEYVEWSIDDKCVSSEEL